MYFKATMYNIMSVFLRSVSKGLGAGHFSMEMLLVWKELILFIHYSFVYLSGFYDSLTAPMTEQDTAWNVP